MFCEMGDLRPCQLELNAFIVLRCVCVCVCVFTASESNTIDGSRSTIASWLYFIPGHCFCAFGVLRLVGKFRWYISVKSVLKTAYFESNMIIGSRSTIALCSCLLSME